MIELPLFPLNLVLFPGMPLNLHIFEDRYKLMINECIDERKPFGVLLIANQEPDISRLAEPVRIGCTAHINQVQPLTNGRMNIVVVGKDRFRIESFHHDKTYLSGTASFYPVQHTLTHKIDQTSRQLRRYLSHYMDALRQTQAGIANFRGLPADPERLAYLAAMLLQTDVHHKQSLLEIETLPTLLQALNSAYRVETQLIDTLLNPPTNEQSMFFERFSLN